MDNWKSCVVTVVATFTLRTFSSSNSVSRSLHSKTAVGEPVPVQSSLFFHSSMRCFKPDSRALYEPIKHNILDKCRMLRLLDGYGLCSDSAARPRLTPRIRFLFIDSRFCSALLSDPPRGRSPCASLILHLHQVGWKTFTSKLLNMLGTHL